MTNEEMAKRLGIDHAEFEILVAKEIEGVLPRKYLFLRDYLGTELLELQNSERRTLMDAIEAAYRQVKEFEEAEQFIEKLRKFVANL